MKLPRIQPHRSSRRHPGIASSRVGGRVVPQVTRQQRDDAQDYINRNCHGLSNCANEGCAAARSAQANANRCVAERETVMDYYSERNIDDPGDHPGARDHDQAVANSCAQRFNSRSCRTHPANHGVGIHWNDNPHRDCRCCYPPMSGAPAYCP
ncbi:MAG: hypothetical protein AAF799_06910 [Myxococcota bacterium]